jgi:hypothetical protein
MTRVSRVGEPGRRLVFSPKAKVSGAKNEAIVRTVLPCQSAGACTFFLDVTPAMMIVFNGVIPAVGTVTFEIMPPKSARSTPAKGIAGPAHFASMHGPCLFLVIIIHVI